MHAYIGETPKVGAGNLCIEMYRDAREARTINICMVMFPYLQLGDDHAQGTSERERERGGEGGRQGREGTGPLASKWKKEGGQTNSHTDSLTDRHADREVERKRPQQREI